MKPEDHNRIIDLAFGPTSDGPHLSDWDRATLKRASADVDDKWTGQGAAGSFKHSMRAEYQLVPHAQALAKAFVSYHLQLAADLQRGGSHDRALYSLGEAMHTIADGFSPLHDGFKPWCGDGLWCAPSDAVHAWFERRWDMSYVNREAAMALRRYYEEFRELSGRGR